MEFKHVSVMKREAVEYLNPKPGQYFIDCTLGGAGYTMAIAEKVGDTGKVLAIDLDPAAIENAKIQIKNKYSAQGGSASGGKNIILVNENFKNLSQIIEDNRASTGTDSFDGIVFDLGLSGYQLEDRSRGFSFREDAPLKMEFGEKNLADSESTEEIVNNWREGELKRIIKDYGEDRFAGYIARMIVEYRKLKRITTTGQLVDIINQAVPKKFQHGKIHPATRTFQALRIATNMELTSLEQVLPQAVDALKPGGRIAVVSFHSLEDRIVKHYFKNEALNGRLKIITKKIIEPTEEEINANPKSRSAKLRVAERI